MNKLLYHLGNILILASLIGFGYIFYPFLQLYVTPPPTVQKVAAKEGVFVTIPKINAQAPIIENVDPWNESVYNASLKKGVAHAKDTALPGENGTMFLFAHSSGLPWELTRYNTIFLRLNELRPKDSILVTKNGKEYRYVVREAKEVWPNEVNYLLQTEKDQLILQTCTPVGTSLKRLLVFADPQ